MKTVVVTGANGFIGRYLVRILATSAFKVQGIDSDFGDISDGKTWSRLPPADVVIHLAAKSSVASSWLNPADFVQTNCLGTSLALEFCRLHGAKLIFLSSYMYGDAGSLPISETATVHAKNPYALTKHISEQLCKFFAENFGVDSRILRPFNVFGPEQDETFLIPKIIREAVMYSKVNVKDLEPRRDYVFVDDLIQAIISLIDYSGPYRIFNIGTGKSYSVTDVIQTVEALLGKRVEISCENIRRPGEIMDSVANIELAKRELSWTPNFSLADGLSRILRQP
jgi:nucleoside-diphosphate-sugar epimerase